MGKPRHEPAKSISEVLEKYFKGIGFDVTSKDLKRLRDSSNPDRF